MALETTNIDDGVFKIYKTKDNGQDCYLNGDIKTNKRIKLAGDWEQKSPGIWEGTPTDGMHPPSARVNINTTNPDAYKYDKQRVHGINFTDLKTRGFILDDKDFRNFELTTYFKIVEVLDDANAGKMSGYGRGGRHSDEGWPDACLGVCYKGVVSTQDGESWFEKEYHHFSGSTGYGFDTKTHSNHLHQEEITEIDFGDDGTDVWIGQKFIVYDIPEGAKCELWVDKNAKDGRTDPTKQQWVLINELFDKGDQPGPREYGDDMKHNCKCETVNPIFAWGGPTVTWRIDNCKVQHTKVSIREIQVPPVRA